MTYRDYQPLKIGENLCSVGKFGVYYAFEILTGAACAPEYYQITKAEFDAFPNWEHRLDEVIQNVKCRKCLCGAYVGETELDPKDLMTEQELERNYRTMR